MTSHRLLRGLAGPSKEPMRLARRLMATVAPILLTVGCAGHGSYLSGEQTGLGKPPYQIGPVTVLLRSQPEVELICRLSAGGSAPMGRIHGCYVPADKMIVSTADPYVLIHEFKHYFDGTWHD